VLNSLATALPVQWQRRFRMVRLDSSMYSDILVSRLILVYLLFICANIILVLVLFICDISLVFSFAFSFWMTQYLFTKLTIHYSVNAQIGLFRLPLLYLTPRRRGSLGPIFVKICTWNFERSSQMPNVQNRVKILPKSLTVWIGCTNVTDRRQTDDRHHCRAISRT